MNRIKQLRIKKGLTIAELSKETGIPKTSLTNYENSKRTPRKKEVWEILSDFFEVDIPYLMGLYDGTQKEWNELHQDLQTKIIEFFAPITNRNTEKLIDFLNNPDKEIVGDLINIFASIAEGYFHLYETDKTKKQFESYRKILFKIEKYATLSFDENDDFAKQFITMRNDELAIKDFFEYAYYLLLKNKNI
ncbi:MULTISPECIES: helix-turn-helix domain-containing protein [Enterococcus]|uniref:helix-turn-helix domain-containing protein n=1 Tax=Enterococcus TaxID=1350 RepID=UPI0034A55132